MKGEMVFIRLFDIGRNVNLEKLMIIASGVKSPIRKDRKDTPQEIYLPQPLIIESSQHTVSTVPFLKNIIFQAKVYGEGVLSLITRMKFEGIALNQIHTLRSLSFPTVKGELDVDKWSKLKYQEIHTMIKAFVSVDAYTEFTESEDYTLFCITDVKENPEAFIKANRHYLATLLMTEKPETPLHDSQIDSTLSHPFSYLKNDLVIFDYDRAVILDDQEDYEDILIVAELANYQLLELRNLDKNLDNQLNLAEDDIRRIFFRSKAPIRVLTKKLGELLRLKTDMMFMLENVENVSKIIGNYYLADLYTHLGSLFSLEKWSKSIRNRLETLDSIYTMSRTDVNERIMVYLEILLAFIFITEFILLIFGIS